MNGTLRIGIDPPQLNRALLRERDMFSVIDDNTKMSSAMHTTLDNPAKHSFNFFNLGLAKVFSKLDLQNGY